MSYFTQNLILYRLSQKKLCGSVGMLNSHTDIFTVLDCSLNPVQVDIEIPSTNHTTLVLFY